MLSQTTNLSVLARPTSTFYRLLRNKSHCYCAIAEIFDNTLGPDCMTNFPNRFRISGIPT